MNLTAPDVYDTMIRYCDLHDCHDLWLQALQLVQAFTSRPRQAGVIAGGLAIGIGMPASDLRVGAIGPMLAGVTAEGMKTEAMMAPDIREFLYGGAVRGTFFTASYFEGLKALGDNHPVKLAVGQATHRHFRALSQPLYARQFIEKEVAPRAAAAGWDCVNEAMKWAVPLINRHNVSTVLNAERVPWWTTVMPHLPSCGGPFLKDWLLPAGLAEQPDSGRWYACRMLGITTEGQVAAALRWAGANLRYVVWHNDGTMRRHQIARARPNRFLPRVQPIVILGNDVAQASVQFTGNVTKTYELLRQLGRCTPELVFTHATAWEHPADHFHFSQPGAELPSAPRLTRLTSSGANNAESHDRPHSDLPPPDPARIADLEASVNMLRDVVGTAPLAPDLAQDTTIVDIGWQTRMSDLVRSLSRVRATDVMQGHEPDVQLRRVRAYCHLLTRTIDLTSHWVVVRTDSEMLMERRAEAIGLARLLEQRQQRADIEAGPDHEDTLRDALNRTAPGSPEEVTLAPDDPTAPVQNPEDFGEATSAQGSGSQSAAANDVAQPSQTLVSLGFVPPGTSQPPSNE
nr:MAG: hypothetical protein H1Rhizo26FD511_000002 [Totiviridae sp.]